MRDWREGFEWKPSVTADDLEKFKDSRLWKTLKVFLEFQMEGILDDLGDERDLMEIGRLQGERRLLMLVLELPEEVKNFIVTNEAVDKSKIEQPSGGIV